MTLPSKQLNSLRRKLEQSYEASAREEFLTRDPLGQLDRHISPSDFEFVSFIMAGLSYGRVEQIQKSFHALMLRLEKAGIGPQGKDLHRFLIETNETTLRKELRLLLKGWVHRLNTERDIEDLLLILSRLGKENESLANVFFKKIPQGPEEALALFSKKLSALNPNKTIKNKSKEWRGTGPQWFYSSPTDGSTCKRLLMWLRWMCRQDAIDPGTWRVLAPKEFKKFSPQQNYLFWPVDTHILKWAQKENLVSRKTASWAFAKELTAIGKILCPEDPIKYDFSICHSGITSFRTKTP